MVAFENNREMGCIIMLPLEVGHQKNHSLSGRKLERIIYGLSRIGFRGSKAGRPNVQANGTYQKKQSDKYAERNGVSTGDIKEEGGKNRADGIGRHSERARKAVNAA